MAILTVSREYGSGGTEIGKAVAASLGYEYIDRDRILEDLKAAGPKWEEWAEELDEHCPTVWERNDWSFRGFAALIQAEVLGHALKDRVVLMGRGGNFLLEGIPSAYRIRVVAPLDARVARVANQDQVNRETARWLIEKTDRERACFIQSIFGRPWDDPEAYDAVFEARGEFAEDIVQAVVGALSERDKLNTEEVKRALRMRAAAARLKAGIATNTRFFVPILDVTVEAGSLVLRGVVHSTKEHRLLEEEAKRLAGDLPLRCDLHYRG